MTKLCETCQHNMIEQCFKPLRKTGEKGEAYYELTNIENVLNLDGTCHYYKKKTITYKLNTYFSQKFYSIKMYYWHIRSFFKNNLYGRMKYGFNIEETWNLQDSITDYIYPRLKYLFNNDNNGHPGILTIEFCNEHNLNQYNLNDTENMFEIWDQIKDQILLGFEIMYNNNKNFKTETKEDRVNIDESLRLFSLFYNCLWS